MRHEPNTHFKGVSLEKNKKNIIFKQSKKYTKYYKFRGYVPGRTLAAASAAVAVHLCERTDDNSSCYLTADTPPQGARTVIILHIIFSDYTDDNDDDDENATSNGAVVGLCCTDD